MSRLVDYFVIVGFDHEKQRGGLSNGIILQRFPEINWEDTPFLDGIQWFCQPQGWALSTERSEPQFYVSVLTDVDANKHYCACLCFNETVSVTPTKPADEDEESIDTTLTVANITHQSLMYAPKCIVIVSRQDYIDTFRNCLGIIYTVWVENVGVPLETLVGNLVGGVVVAEAGGPAVRFSLGAGDRQCLQPPAAPPLPVTHTAVHTLLRLLGIHNTITLWCAVMCEHKVLLVSLAAARLAAVCRALAALMFPFRYAHVYIPLLPAGLAEVLATPTPFLIGVHSSLKDDVNELLDVIVADLDVGSLRVPSTVTVPRPGGRALSRLQGALALVLQPELRAADVAFAPPTPAASPPHLLDKELRAVFMRTLAALLQGYRHCLTVIRTVPSPVLAFHKAGFLGARGLDQCGFTQRLLDSMFFSGFVHERGPPWRTTDIFDDLIQNLPEQLRLESMNPNLELEHIQELAKQIHLNENPNTQPVQQRVLRPPAGSAGRVHQPPLPRLDAAKVHLLITELASRNAHNSIPSIRCPPPRIVPIGAPPTGAVDEHSYLLANSVRRIEVLSDCVNAIFECRYADASKSLPAVRKTLEAPAGRAALLAHLTQRLPANKHLLQHQQFDLVVRLMNYALQLCTAYDEHSVAAAMLPLATAYCRKLCTGVIQYAYMCIQEHAIWASQQFWEAAYYQEVQRDIRALYQPAATTPRPGDDEELASVLRAQELTALEIAAEQMRIWPTLDPEKQAELKSREESTLYSQALHYANRMVYLLLPLEGAGRRSEHRPDDQDRASNSFTNSVAESDSVDAESGFEEADPGEAGNNVIKMVSRFIDKVCTEGGVSAGHVRSLHQMVPGVVHMQLETLDHVARESRRLPPVQKPRIVTPSLVVGETVEGGWLRCVLVGDGREAPLLPAEGALFLTNYRVIFQGTPTDPYACEQVIVRSFPVCSLTREKSIRTHYLPLEQSLQEGLQLRSATFQLIKVALDEEVSAEQVESFRKSLSRLRHPPHPLLHFAFCGRPSAPISHQHLAKNNTLKGFAKKTLMKTARKAGLKPKPSKRQKYVLPSSDARSLTSPPLMSSISADTLSLEELDLGVVESEPVSDARTLERLRDRPYVRDWARVGLNEKPFTLCMGNATYGLTRTYPAVLPVPERLTEEALRKLARQYRHGRLPVLTWRHVRNGALLARSAAPHHKGVIGMLKSSHQQQGVPQPGTEPASSLEMERYLHLLADCTPAARGDLEDSSLSLDSLLLCCDDNQPIPHTPLLTKAAGTLSVLSRNSGGKGGATRPFSRWSSLRGHDLHAHRHSTAEFDDGGVSSVGGCPRPPLYVVGERGGGGAEHVPVEGPDPRATRHAFKKLMRAAVPSAPPPANDHSFHKLIEESGWLTLLRHLFQVSGAVVDLLDLQGSSVLISLEDGWDATAQISSLAQVCLDPCYRTLDGFRVLIEKEWLAMGHKFQTRSNLGPNPTNTFTPTFIMFLDSVHQLQKQFPMSFEFNDYYLRFLAYHSVSCRFRTFLTDSEAQRAELGITAADHKRDTARMGVETGAEEGGALGQSVFEHIDKTHQKSPVFYNFLYTPDFDNPVLRPVYSIPMLELWDYYVCEELGGSAPYDRDVASPPRPRDCRTVTAGLDPVARCLPDAFTALLERARQLDLELAHLPQKWRVRWEQLELPNTLQLQRAASLSSGVVRTATRLAHKRGTFELLVRGRLSAPAPPHRFAPAPPTHPAHCDHCNTLLGGPLKSGLRCAECGAVCHERCSEQYAAPCGKLRAAPIDPPAHVTHAPSACGTASSLQQYYEHFSSNVAENRTHEGHLYKRGALLKGWKQRWFVLDSIKHQLRYYDAMEDSHCKGFIDLAEVITVSQAPPAPGPPKKCDDRSFFDLRTSRRTYNFCASDATAAQEWIEKLQACLQ